jgi:hypothetical protein
MVSVSMLSCEGDSCCNRLRRTSRENPLIPPTYLSPLSSLCIIPPPCACVCVCVCLSVCLCVVFYGNTGVGREGTRRRKETTRDSLFPEPFDTYTHSPLRLSFTEPFEPPILAPLSLRSSISAPLFLCVSSLRSHPSPRLPLHPSVFIKGRLKIIKQSG